MSQTPSPQPLHVLGIGVAVRDVAVLLDEFPVPDQKYRARGLFEEGGGPVATALVTLSRWGHRTTFCGVVGAGTVGRLIVESLQKESVDTSAVVFRDGLPSPTSVILVEHGRRTIFECWQADLPLRFEEIETRDLPFHRFDCLLVDARMPDVQIESARRVRSAGGKVVLDCGHPRPGIEEILTLTDIAICSHTYPRTLYGRDYDLEAFLVDLASRLPADGPRIAGLTLGAAGCAVHAPGQPIFRVTGHEVNAVDSTGAGDVFHGAFVHAYMKGRSLEESARFANAAAAMKCTGMTGRPTLPSEDEIWQLAQGHARRGIR